MPKATIKFGELHRDTPNFRKPGNAVFTATNLSPARGHYARHGSLTDISTALDARCLGSAVCRSQAGAVFHYAGDATKLYEMVVAGLAFSDQSKGGGYTVASGDVWEFAVWDRNFKIIATNWTDAVQSMTIGGGAAGAFADMITSTLTPKAKHVGIIGNFVVLGYTNDATDAIRPQRVWWSAFGDETDFDPDAATQCDYEDLATGGAVQKIVGGNEYGYVIQRDRVCVMRYVGGGVIFEIIPIQYAPGTVFPNSVIAYKGTVYYIAGGDFFAITGLSVKSIGEGRVNIGFPTGTALTNSWVISTGVDERRNILYWAVNDDGSTTPNKMYLYNVETDMWATLTLSCEMLTQIDLSDYGKTIAAFNTTHKIAAFGTVSTNNLAATIETGDYQPIDGHRWQINGIKPLVNAEGGTNVPINVSVGRRERMDDAVTFATAVPTNSYGLAPVRVSGTFMRLRASLTSSVGGQLYGFEMDYELLGER